MKPNPIDRNQVSYIREAVPLGHSAPRAQPTQLDWLGNLSNLLDAAEDCFVCSSNKVYHENLRAWNTSDGNESVPYSERGPHKLPSVCSLTWHDGIWEMHLLLEDFLEVIEGLFADGRLNKIRRARISSDFEMYLAGDFTMIRHGSGSTEDYYYYYELSYTPATMSSLRIFALANEADLGNTRDVLARCGIHIEWEE